jgi:putative hydrolase of HD superfamily
MQTSFTKYLQFFKISQRLKFVKRAGWTRFAFIKDVESVSDHSWMISLLALSLPKIDNFNRDLCLKIALLHDLAEVLVGDITP